MVLLRKTLPALLLLLAWPVYQAWRHVALETTKAEYLHDEFVVIRLKTRRRIDPLPEFVVKRNGQEITTIAGIKRFRLKPDLTAKWPVPWNAEVGEYEAVPLSDLGGLKPVKFRIGRRVPAPLPKGMSVLTLETVSPLKNMRLTAPDGTRKDWTAMLDWAVYIGADAFWMLGGETPGKKPGQIWVETNQDMIAEAAREARKRGLKFGVYAMCYLTMSPEQVGGYEYAKEVKDGKPVPTRAISLRDPKRPKDVAALLKSWRDIPEVDYVGLDYIRNPLGGYEMAEQFFEEMPGVSPPPEWRSMSPDERMVWFARKKITRLDQDFIDAWQWWRAHKVAGIVRGIKAELGSEKPLWAFTLTWDKGWHHGQDPVMMNDAGVDADALMLYEATKRQYDTMIADWRKYLKRGDAQLIVGDVIDWPLHQNDPEGPKEFYRRTAKAFDRIYSDGPAFGVFFHDAARAYWGRRGPWSMREWMDEAKRATAHAKENAR